MSLRTRIARWEHNHRAWRVQLHGPREEGLGRFLARPLGEIVTHAQISHADYLATATPEVQADDFRGGVWRLARRAGAVVAAGTLLYAMYGDDMSVGAAPPQQPAIIEETNFCARTICR